MGQRCFENVDSTSPLDCETERSRGANAAQRCSTLFLTVKSLARSRSKTPSGPKLAKLLMAYDGSESEQS